SGKSTGFIIGSEGSGISAQVLKSSDETVYIPMNAPSSISSLNASVSAALAIYEWVRQTSFCGV
ncbi:MAG: TrmH family RNA methyltransferase, partial [Thermoplasmata archaeon]